MTSVKITPIVSVTTRARRRARPGVVQPAFFVDTWMRSARPAWGSYRHSRTRRPSRRRPFLPAASTSSSRTVRSAARRGEPNYRKPPGPRAWSPSRPGAADSRYFVHGHGTAGRERAHGTHDSNVVRISPTSPYRITASAPGTAATGSCGLPVEMTWPTRKPSPRRESSAAAQLSPAYSSPRLQRFSWDRGHPGEADRRYRSWADHRTRSDRSRFGGKRRGQSVSIRRFATRRGQAVKVGMIGLGGMGKSIAECILNAGFGLTVADLREKPCRIS